MPLLEVLDQFVREHSDPGARYLKNVKREKDNGSVDLRGWARVK